MAKELKKVTIPEGLKNTANGRDILTLEETAQVTNSKPQTLRKHICLYGNFHDIKPIKIGGRWNFFVTDIAKLLSR
jgi:hypothetical protein